MRPTGIDNSRRNKRGPTTTVSLYQLQRRFSRFLFQAAPRASFYSARLADPGSPVALRGDLSSVAGMKAKNGARSYVKVSVPTMPAKALPHVGRVVTADGPARPQRFLV